MDAEGKPLTGVNRYVVRFPKGQVPPVGGFWSVTLYNSKQAFVDNPINRYAIGDRDKLKFDADGALTLYVEHESPGPDKESNWLPAPKDEFNLSCACTCRRRRSSTARGSRRRWSGSSRTGRNGHSQRTARGRKHSSRRQHQSGLDVRLDNEVDKPLKARMTCLNLISPN